jgi:hypothetical protein
LLREHQVLADGAKLAAIAAVSAALTAIVVIFAGRALLAQPHAAASERPALTPLELRQALPIEA